MKQPKPPVGVPGTIIGKKQTIKKCRPAAEIAEIFKVVLGSLLLFISETKSPNEYNLRLRD